jgi:hypothetical protein
MYQECELHSELQGGIPVLIKEDAVFSMDIYLTMDLKYLKVGIRGGNLKTSQNRLKMKTII